MTTLGTHSKRYVLFLKYLLRLLSAVLCTVVNKEEYAMTPITKGPHELIYATVLGTK